MASIGMFGLIGMGLLFDNTFHVLKKYAANKGLWVLSFFFLIVLVSGLYSTDKDSWLNWLRIKLPYLFLPFAFAGLRKIELKKFIAILYAFVLTMSISAAVILIKYALHYNQITDSILNGSTIPIPYSHIRYTLMLAFAFFCCTYLFNAQIELFDKREKWLQVFLATFIFAALHVLAVRSGLVALYLGVLYLLITIIIKERKFIWGAALIAMVTCLPFFAYRYIPAFHNRMSYMHYDLEMYGKGDVNNKNDAMRLISMKAGIEVWKKNIWLGVGAGDIKTETDKVYNEKFSQVTIENRRLPHNQFLWVLATTGIAGLALFLTAFFVPLFTNKLYRYWPVVVLHLALFSSFFTEDTLEEQIGTGFYLIFLLLFMNHFSSNG